MTHVMMFLIGILVMHAANAHDQAVDEEIQAEDANKAKIEMVLEEEKEQ